MFAITICRYLEGAGVSARNAKTSSRPNRTGKPAGLFRKACDIFQQNPPDFSAKKFNFVRTNQIKNTNHVHNTDKPFGNPKHGNLGNTSGNN